MIRRKFLHRVEEAEIILMMTVIGGATNCINDGGASQSIDTEIIKLPYQKLL